MRQLDPEDGCLDCVHAAVPADFFVIVTAGAAVVAEVPHVRSQIQIAGGYQPRVAIGAQILGGIKAECRGCAERSCTPVSPFCPDRLRRIFDDRQMEFICDLLQPVHVSALAVEMYRQQSSDFVRTSSAEPSLHALRIQIQCVGFHVDQHRPCASAHDGTGRCEKAEGSGDYSIAGGGLQRRAMPAKVRPCLKRSPQPRWCL